MHSRLLSKMTSVNKVELLFVHSFLEGPEIFWSHFQSQIADNSLQKKILLSYNISAEKRLHKEKGVIL